MSIGVFDSGVGGLTVHRALVNRLPQADFTYLADQANAPYGGRPGEEVVELTKAGCERLFDTGASLVVLACNTASAIALRRLQQTWLPGYRKALGRPINVLGIIVPTIEAATGLPWEHEAERRGDKVEQLDVLGVFSTQGTTNSRVYEIEIDKRKQDIAVFSQPCPDLVPMIEADAGVVDLAKAVEGYVQR
jgi:glutamate racemase